MFRWLTQYFQNKSDAKKNLMVPTRKPAVKIKLKSINFKKGPVEERLEAEKQGGLKPDISSSFVDVSPRPEAPPQRPEAPSQIPGETRRLDTEELRSKIYENKPLNVSTIMFAVAVLFCLTALGIIYVSSERSQRQVYRDKCQNAYREGVAAGYDLGGVNCQLEDGFLASLDISEAKDAYERVEAQVASQRTTLGDTQAGLDIQINTLRGYLQAFGVNPSRIPPAPLATTDVNNSITEKQQYIAQLEALLEEEAGDLQETLQNYNLLLESNPDLDLSSEREYYERFIARTPTEQYASYRELVLRYNELVDKVGRLQDNPFVATTLLGGGAGAFKFFNGEEFKQLWETTAKPDTNSIGATTITGDVAADRRIIEIAEGRGYARQVQAATDKLVALENELVLPPVREAYNQLRAAAEQDGVNLGVVSGFRSPDTQRDIFLARLNAASIAQRGVETNAGAIARGEFDDVIDSVLVTSSIPGYSRHHTGLALDLQDNNSAESFTLFKDTAAFDWISANNYANAKKFGFIPSYPEGASKQGPEPEAWEYVWVGTDAVLN